MTCQGRSQAQRLLACALIAACGEVPAQVGGSKNEDTPVIRSNSRVVQIDVTVKDGQGRPISGLAATDFQVTDNGKQRAIPIFGIGDGATARIEVNGSGKNGNAKVRLYLEPRSVSLKNQDGIAIGNIDDMFLELDRRDAVVGKIGDHVQFKVTAAQRPSYDRTGLSFVKSLRLQAGAVKIKVIVRDRSSGHVGSLTIPLTPSLN